MEEQEKTPEVPRLSASIAHKLLTECPLSAWMKHRLLGNVAEEKKDSQVTGNLWHAAILEGGRGIEVCEFDSFRSAEAKAAKSEAIMAGKIPISRPKWDEMLESVPRIQRAMREQGIEFDGAIEERIEWDQLSTSGELVACSGYIDHRSGLHIDDLKTGPGITSVDMAQMLISRSHSILQDAVYRSAVASIHDADFQRTTMRYIFVQTKEPYVVTPVDLDGEFQEISYLRWQRAIDLWAKCLGRGTDRQYWPGPVKPGTTATLHPPGWMLAKEMELESING